MKYYIFILIIGAASAAPRIIGGRPTNITEVPYQLELDNKGSFQCGGVILGPQVAITGGHCVKYISAASLTVRVGATTHGEGKLHTISTYIIHPNYTSNWDGIPNNDIAILKINEPFEFNEAVQPIKIATEEPDADVPAVVSGWGSVEEIGDVADDLNSVAVSIVDRDLCAQPSEYQGRITPAMICAGVLEGGKGSCHGDSGGPLVADGVLVGTVSWAYGCARPDYPNVFANIAYFKDWINEQMSSN